MSLFDKKPAVYVGNNERWYRLVDKTLPGKTTSIAVDGEQGLLYFSGQLLPTEKKSGSKKSVQKRDTNSPSQGFISVSSLTSLFSSKKIWTSDSQDNSCIPSKLSVSETSGNLYFSCSRTKNELLGDLIIMIDKISKKSKILVSLAGRVVGLSEIENRLYWSDADKYEIRSISVTDNNSNSDGEEGRFETSLDKITVEGMTMINRNSGKEKLVKSSNPCAVDNGNCDGVCLLGDGAYK